MGWRRRPLVAAGCAVVAFLLSVAVLVHQSPSLRHKLLGQSHETIDQLPPTQPDEPEYFPWHTRSQFQPVQQAVEHKSIKDLCKAFPKELLRDIQPVLKTGHAVLDARIEPQLRSVSACLDDQLLIFSDLDEDFHGYQVTDVVSDLRADFIRDNDQLHGYVLQTQLAENGTLQSEHSPLTGGWEVDKFKFLPQVSRAWRMRPEKRWYVFYEDDTYIVWDNILRLLTNFNPDMPWYFGSPAPGARDGWMAYGGSGYVLSREAVRRLVKDDFDLNGVFIGSKLSERWEDQMMHDCCGDSVLGLALHEDARTNLSGLWPMFQPHPLHGIPFSDDYWCQPVISMHKTSFEDMAGLRTWEETRRKTRRPLLFADLVDYLKLTKVGVREDWINNDWGGYPAPPDTPAHASFDACGQACKADQDCLQWTYHLRSCAFTSLLRLGQARKAEVEAWRTDEEKAFPWSRDDKKFKAGWDLDGIKRWMEDEGRQCKTIRWVRPSIERIF